MGLTVRRLGASDLDLVRAALRAVYGDEVGGPGPLLTDPRAHLLVAFDDESPVGLAYGYELPRLLRGTTAMLMYEIEVAPAARRRGAGRALMEEFRALCAELDVDSMWLLTDDGNPPAQALYRGAQGERHPVDQVMFRFRPPWR